MKEMFEVRLNSGRVWVGWFWIAILILLLALAIGGCSPQFYEKTEFRSQHYTQMPDAAWCARAQAEKAWTPPECTHG